MEEETIQCELQDPLVKKVNPGAGVSEDQLTGNCMSSQDTVQMLSDIVAAFHFPNVTWIFVNSVFTAR